MDSCVTCSTDIDSHVTCSTDIDSHITCSKKIWLFINCMQLQGFPIDIRVNYSYDNLVYTVARLEACVHCFQSSFTFSTYRYNWKRFSSLHAMHKTKQHSFQQLSTSVTQVCTLGEEAVTGLFSKCH